MAKPPTVALATASAFPELDKDERLVIPALADQGVVALPVIWDDPEIDWNAYDLVVIRSTWDYINRREEFLTWARRVPRLLNSAELIEWNTDKTYLSEVAAAGVVTVPTDFYHPGVQPVLPTKGVWVLKPAIGAGSVDVERFDLTSSSQQESARTHVSKLHNIGRTAMLQPYLSAVDHHGETSLIYFNSRFSHAVRKGPMLMDNSRDDSGFSEEITPRSPGADEFAAAERVLSILPDDHLYARIDLIPGRDGVPTLVELELTEPALFLGEEDGAAARFAREIAARL